MATAVVVDAVALPLQSPTRLSPRAREMLTRSHIREDFRRYELSALAVTQLSYIPVAATMLATSFYEPSKEFCNEEYDILSDVILADKGNSTEFTSLLYSWGIPCSGSHIVATLSTSLMLGALCGAFIAGWVADAYGRRPVLRGSLLCIAVGNLILVLLAPFSITFTGLVLLLLGMACGGYMVTNLVLVVECLELPRSRLLAVSMNGWSLSMAAVALVARLTLHWLSYHLLVAGLAILAVIGCHFVLLESCRWLAGIHRISDAKAVAMTIAKRNSMTIHTDMTWWELLGFSQPCTPEPQVASSGRKEYVRTYGYKDLFSVPSVYWPLIALSYCFVASSIVSFGFYFTIDALPGDRYGNMAIMGMTKFVMGWIPFAVSSFIGRKPIVLISVGVACAAAWTLCISQWFGMSADHWSLSLLSLVIAASLDPTWKINHLYSAELFPTVVRNMARGVCNVGARLGSVAAPVVVHLRAIHYMIPFIVFAFLLTIQWLIAAGFLPETKDRPLVDEFPERRKKENKVPIIIVESCEDSSEL